MLYYKITQWTLERRVVSHQHDLFLAADNTRHVLPSVPLEYQVTNIKWHINLNTIKRRGIVSTALADVLNMALPMI